MQKETAGRGKQPVCLHQARLQKAEVVVERIAVPHGAELRRAIALPLEADPVAVVVACRGEACAALGAPGVERRIDVDQIETRIGERLQDVEVVAEVNVDHRVSLRAQVPVSLARAPSHRNCWPQRR
jgi:hypothetical protein